MNDWIKLIQEFKNILSHERFTPMPIAIREDIQVQLLHCMVCMDATQKRTKIASNFIVAAMHLAFLKRSDERNLVNLPDNALMLFHG